MFSDFLSELYREHGVELLLGDGIEGFAGNGRVQSVRTASGRDVEADLVVVGVGVAPSTGWLEGSGLELDNGVVVDSELHASTEDVFAAGDVANFEDPDLQAPAPHRALVERRLPGPPAREGARGRERCL